MALTGDTSDVAIVLTTLVLAGTFSPLRKALEGFVDRHFKPAARAPADPMPPEIEPTNELREIQARLARLEQVLANADRSDRQYGSPARIAGSGL